MSNDDTRQAIRDHLDQIGDLIADDTGAEPIDADLAEVLEAITVARGALAEPGDED